MILKSLLLCAAIVSLAPDDNGLLEDRGIVDQSIDDWKKIERNYILYSGDMYCGWEAGTFHVNFIDPRAGKQILKQRRVGNGDYPRDIVRTRMWKTPAGYIFTLDDSPDPRKFWLLDFTAQ